jgi:hypothetical protein
MVERKMDPRFNLVDDKMVRQIRADSPVRFARSLVIDPPAAGCLEERVHQQQQELTIRSKHSRYFGDRRLERIYVLNSEAQDYRFKRRTTKWKLFRCGLHESRRPAAHVRLPNLRSCRVQAHHFRTAPGDAPGYLPLSTSHIEHAARFS